MSKVDELRRDVNESRLEMRSGIESLTKMVENRTVIQNTNTEKVTLGMDTMDETTQILIKRMDKLENSSTALGENSHRELKMLEIERARHGVKILGMREKATEINAKMYIKNRLSLTQIALASMGVQHVFRLGKHPTQESDGCPPVIMIFTTKYMVETILNAARSEGLRGTFKEHIDESYSKAHMNFMQI